MQELKYIEKVDAFTRKVMATDDEMNVSAIYTVTAYGTEDGVVFGVYCIETENFDRDFLVSTHYSFCDREADTLAEAMQEALHHFNRLVKHYREAWLDL
jgi:hypothetical protein